MRTVTSLSVVYVGRLSFGGHVGPVITVVPESRTLVVDDGRVWDVRIGAETTGAVGRCVPVDYKPRGRGRWRCANPLREQDA